MIKKVIVLIILLSLNISIGFTQETQTITITESTINEAIDRFLEENERNFDIDAKLSEEQIGISITSEDPNFNYERIEWTIVPTIQEGRVIWTLATWEATDSDGNPVISDTRIQSFTPNIMNIWGRTLRNIVRGETSENGLSISGIEVRTGSLTAQIDGLLPDANDDELPPNASENADGSVTVNISQEMMNQSLTAIQNRYDAIDTLSVDMTDNTFNFAIGVEAICDAPIDVQYGFQDSVRTINGRFEIGDWNENGTNELIIRVNPSENTESFYAIELVNVFCQGETVSAQQSERINSLILPAVRRFLQLQSCNNRITNIDVLERSIVLILPQYTTCLTTHL